MLDEADDMIENFAGECMFVKRAASKGRTPPQVRERGEGFLSRYCGVRRNGAV